MAILEALFGTLCRTEDLSACCGCKDEPEVLTKAWIDSLEQVSVLGETVVKVQHPPALRGGGPGPAQGGHGAEAPSPQGRAQPPLPGAAAGQVATRSGNLTMLAVPPEFDGVRGGVLQPSSPSTLPRAVGIPPSAVDEQRQCLQACMRAFTRSLLRGVGVSVLLDDGCTCLAEARMDSELTHFVLHVPNAQHPVALRSIESVSPPEESWLPQVGGARPGQLDLCCATLIIEGGQFLTLVFDTPRTREYFEVCLKVLILARESGSPTSRHNPEQRYEGAAGAVPPRIGDEGPLPRPSPLPDSDPGTDECGEQQLSWVRDVEPPPPPPEPPVRAAGLGEPTSRV